jgi:hypothetical protein
LSSTGYLATSPKPTANGIFTASLITSKAWKDCTERIFIWADDGWAGGVYLWENMDAAKVFYSGPWVDGIRARYGMDPIIRYFETSAITDNVDVVPGVRRLNSPRANVAA